jgi:ATP-dependent DNA helicase RecQ
MQDDMAATLHTVFGFDTFRPGQGEAIASILRGEHALVVMPTGAGKSLVYQLCALHRPGVTLVVSPLIALMKDQVDSLARRGVPATYINSSISGEEQTERLQALASGALRLVYVAPERLRSVPFRQALRQATLGLLAVDEAHCISQWGHDFRPDYLHIAAAREEMGNPLTVALTATATPQVQDDIVARLGVPSARRIITGFNRPNLSFEVRYVADDKAKLYAIQELLAGLAGGAAIIYAGTRRMTEEAADFVHGLGHEVRYYHAGLDADARTLVQESFIAGDLPVVVATNAFGMGIDRADVRMVIHCDMPGTLEAYYQEAGRAGRDGDPARALLLYSPRDRALQEYFIENDAPAATDLRRLYNAVRSSSADVWLSRDDLSLATGLPDIKIRVGMAQLEAVGALEHLGDDGMRMLLRRGAWNDAAVQATTDGVEQRRAHRRDQLAAMIAYSEANSCRRRIILDHFGDRGPADAAVCCDNCQARAAAPTPAGSGDLASMSHAERAALIILDTVRRMKWSVGRKKLAQTLAGSQASAMKEFGYDSNLYYGRLAVFKIREIEHLINQMIDMKYLKVIGGEQPVLRLTPQGQAALKAHASIPLQLPRPVQQQKIVAKKAERAAGSTYALTAQMLAQGLTPQQIAAQRVLSLDTIYNHLAREIAEGSVPVERVVSADVIEKVRAVIVQAGSVSYLAPLKMSLPPAITYGEIRCVVEAWKREKGVASSLTAPLAEERIKRVAALGDARNREAVPDLVLALSDSDGNVRRLASSALGKIRDRRAVEPLLTLLSNETKPQVRQYAVKALGQIGDQRAVPALKGIASGTGEREYTRLSATHALRRLSGERALQSDAEQDDAPAPESEADDDAVVAFLARAHPRRLEGPWRNGWALGFHSGFGGADWKRSDVGDLTYRLKYEGDAAAIQPLVAQAADVCREHAALAAADAVVAVPPTQARQLDPVGAFAQALAAALGKPVLAALKKTRRTSPQKEFQTLAQKKANVAGAFAAVADVRGKHLLVLDDLHDSGATLAEVTRVLTQAGAASVCVLTMTRTIHSDR